MTLAVSTSCPWVSLATLDGKVRRTWEAEASRAASGALMEGLQRLGVEPGQVTRVIVDVGPGSFTGVRVGVTFAKVLANEVGARLYAVTSFDLVAAGEPVAIPSKKGETFLRVPGHDPLCVPTGDVPAEARRMEGDTRPRAELAFDLDLREVDPLALAPLYIAAPSISQAKKPHIMGGPPAGS